MCSKCLKLVSVLSMMSKHFFGWVRPGRQHAVATVCLQVSVMMSISRLRGTRQATCCCYCLQVSLNMTSVFRLWLGAHLESVRRVRHWPRGGGLSRPVSPHQTTALGMTVPPQCNLKQMLHPRLTTKITSWKKRSRKLQWLVPVHVWFIGFNNMIYII